MINQREIYWRIRYGGGEMDRRACAVKEKKTKTNTNTHKLKTEQKTKSEVFTTNK